MQSRIFQQDLKFRTFEVTFPTQGILFIFFFHILLLLEFHPEYTVCVPHMAALENIHCEHYFNYHVGVRAMMHNKLRVNPGSGAGTEPDQTGTHPVI